MVCVYCGNETSVINSRLHKKLNRVWRRRQCASCGNVFTTNETSDKQRSFMVRDENGKLLPFSRDIIFISLYNSCGHRQNAIADAAALSDTIMAQLFNYAGSEHAIVTKLEIKQTILKALAHFDHAAATHYEAYHQS